MNTVIAEHTINNTDNNEKSKNAGKCLQQNKTAFIPYNLLY